MKFNALIAFAVLNAVLFAAGAHAENTPIDVVKNFYAPYLLSQEHKGEAPTQSALDLMKPYASNQLKASIQKENDCLERTHELCSIDWDVIVDGQDWNITGLTITPVASDATHQTIRADFKNFDPVQITYYFIREENDWKLDDVEGSLIESLHNNHVQKWKLTELLITPTEE
jgi:hypothetical protein